ncbi:hypothetical protein WN944_009980 [Citrus x changshan-huyou]|uniref:Uncharacterized protein n=1 Tax=Citrus x changshan-huyou TaxID=2935761 RepID=A0AAP0MVJ6_9ROSI
MNPTSTPCQEFYWKQLGKIRLTTQMHMSSDDVISVSSYQSNKVCCRSKLRSPDIQKAKAQQKSPNGFLIKAFNLKHKTCTPMSKEQF